MSVDADKMELLLECLDEMRKCTGKLVNISTDLRNDKDNKQYGMMLKIAVDIIIMAITDLDTMFTSFENDNNFLYGE